MKPGMFYDEQSNEGIEKQVRENRLKRNWNDEKHNVNRSRHGK